MLKVDPPVTGEVVIVGLTELGEGLCVGGIDIGNGRSLRVIAPDRTPWDTSDGWAVGQRYKMTYLLIPNCKPPHVEDVLVLERELIARGRTNVEAAAALIRNWQGSLANCFDGCLCWEPTGAGYIAETNIPGVSTGFWRPSTDLKLDRFDSYWADGTAFNRPGPKRKLKYKGIAPAPEVIPANALVRLSLSRWWTSPHSGTHGCWLQLSGVFVSR